MKQLLSIANLVKLTQRSALRDQGIKCIVEGTCHGLCSKTSSAREMLVFST